MARVNITLSADEALVRKLERLAAGQHVDLQSFLMHVLEGVAHADLDEVELPPLTRAAVNLSKGMTTSGRPYKDILAERMTEKYGRTK